VHNALGQMVPNNLGQKLKKHLLGQREELTTIDNSEYQHLEKLVLINSARSHLVNLAFTMLFVMILFFVQEGERSIIIYLIDKNWFWGIVITLIPITIIALNVIGLIDRKPQLIIDSEGIETRDKKFNWDEIVETRIRFLDGNRPTILIIRTATVEKEIVISDLNETPEFIGTQIELMKKRSA
jgi:hypothetical protein